MSVCLHYSPMYFRKETMNLRVSVTSCKFRHFRFISFKNNFNRTTCALLKKKKKKAATKTENYASFCQIVYCAFGGDLVYYQLYRLQELLQLLALNLHLLKALWAFTRKSSTKAKMVEARDRWALSNQKRDEFYYY